MANVISEFGTLANAGSGTDGANCVITNITPIPGGNRVTFQWTEQGGTTRTETMDVMDGTAGKSIQSVQINNQGHLIVYYDDGTTEDAGYVGGGSGGPATWGNISGTLANQTDLQTALNGKANNAIPITWAEYQLLPSASKLANRYLITDYPDDPCVPISTLKSIVAASSDFADFKTRVAAL